MGFYNIPFGREKNFSTVVLYYTVKFIVTTLIYDYIIYFHDNLKIRFLIFYIVITSTIKFRFPIILYLIRKIIKIYFKISCVFFNTLVHVD